MSVFVLHGNYSEKLRIKSFSSSSRGGKSTIKIEVETEDPFELGYALQKLSEVQKGQRTKPPARKPLALPKPEALP